MNKRKQWAISLALVFAMLLQMTGVAFASGAADLPEETTAVMTASEGSSELELVGDDVAEAETGELSDEVEAEVEGLDTFDKTAPPPATENEADIADPETGSEEADGAEVGEDVTVTDDEFVDYDVAPGVWSDADPYFTDDVLPEIDWGTPFTTFAARPFAMFGMPSVFAETTYPTYAEAYDAMMALKDELYEGREWTNYFPYGRDWKRAGGLAENYYFRGGIIYGARYGVGCAAFCFYLQDQVYGDLPIRIIENPKYEDYHVGDFVRVTGSRGGHFVTITQITSSGVILAEGNYNSSVHWGRSMSKDQLLADTVFLVTRYPAGYTEEANRDDVVATGTEGALSWALTEGGQLTITGNGTMPNYLNGDRPSWESAGKTILSVDIGPGVKSVGDNAFFRLKSLVSVSLPDTIESIGNNAFNGSNVIGIAIPSSCKNVGNDAFGYCPSLASIDIADGVETIGERAFRGCVALRYVDFPSSLKSLGAGAFTSCTELTQVRFMPSSGTLKLGANIFTQCYNLNFVSLPKGITALQPGLFSQCTNVYYLYIPSTVTSLAEAGAESPFMNTTVWTIYFGGTQAQWNSLVNKIPAASYATRMAFSNATVVVEQNDPFVPDENPPADMMTCENGHLGPIEDDVCLNCGKKVSGGTEPVEPVDPPTEHQHEWAEDWSHDTTHHWHECLVGGYFGCENDQKSGYAEHEYDEWIVDVEPTTEANGSRHRVCKVCGHNQTEELEKLTPVDPTPSEHEHSWSMDWNSDVNYHWHECIGEGDCSTTANSAKDGYGQHSYNDWVIDQEATTAQAGSKHRDCAACNYRQTESIPKLPTTPVDPPIQHQHTWSDDWTSDENAHWHECQRSGCTVSSNSQKNGYGQHAYTDWIVDEEATAEEAGSQHRGCMVCGYTQSEVIPATGVVDPVDPPTNEHQHKWATTWAHDDANHWYECEADECPITANSEKDGYGQHSYSDWVIDVEATAEMAGSKHKDCQACNFRVIENIPATGSSEPVGPVDPTPSEHKHNWAKDWVYDKDYHWHQCLSDDCPIFNHNEKDGYAGHNYGAWIVDQAATATQSGNRYRACTVCEYRHDETIPATGGTSTPSNPGTTTRPSGTTKPSDKPGNNVTTPTKPSATPSVITTRNPDGTTKTEVKLPTLAVTNAEQRGEPVTLPMEAVQAAKDVAKAATITIQSDKGGAVKVEIPVVTPTAGTVAILVNPDGSTSVVKTSVPTANGIVATLASGSTVKIVDNSKSFADVTANAWYNDAVAFASAHELFAGTSETNFSPEMPMTRSMLMVVLARFAGAETAGGATWYEKAVEWAKAQGISDGSRPGENITREQLVTMLWRYMGSPMVDDTLASYADADQIGSYARDAMNWAVRNGLVSGFGDGRLGPQGQATRAQVAEIMKNLILNLTK